MPAFKVDIAFDELTPLIPVPWSIEEFINRFAAHRQRPITLEARRMPPLVHALLAVKPDRDFILFDILDSAERCELQILHEVAHLAMQHSLMDETAVSSQIDDVHNSCAYSPDQEAEADLLAATLITTVRSQPQYEAPTELGRLTSTLL